MHRTTKLNITDLNCNLLCVLCSGYLIDATTIIECLHSFCKSCIVTYLESSKYCPICDVQIHKTKPLLNIRSDKTLQDIVYKLVPGLFRDEMKQRRIFYKDHPEEAKKLKNKEDRGEVDELHKIYTEDEKVSLCIQHCTRLPPYHNASSFNSNSKTQDEGGGEERFLLCPVGMTIGMVKKFIRLKYELEDKYQIEVFHSDETINDDYTLMDVAYIYGWRRIEPLKLYYIVFDKTEFNMNLLKKDTNRDISIEVCGKWKKRRIRKAKRTLMESDSDVTVDEDSNYDKSDKQSSSERLDTESDETQSSFAGSMLVTAEEINIPIIKQESEDNTSSNNLSEEKAVDEPVLDFSHINGKKNSDNRVTESNDVQDEEDIPLALLKAKLKNNKTNTNSSKQTCEISSQKSGELIHEQKCLENMKENAAKNEAKCKTKTPQMPVVVNNCKSNGITSNELEKRVSNLMSTNEVHSESSGFSTGCNTPVDESEDDKELLHRQLRLKEIEDSLANEEKTCDTKDKDSSEGSSSNSSSEVKNQKELPAWLDKLHVVNIPNKEWNIGQIDNKNNNYKDTIPIASNSVDNKEDNKALIRTGLNCKVDIQQNTPVFTQPLPLFTNTLVANQNAPKDTVIPLYGNPQVTSNGIKSELLDSHMLINSSKPCPVPLNGKSASTLADELVSQFGQAVLQSINPAQKVQTIMDSIKRKRGRPPKDKTKILEQLKAQQSPAKLPRLLPKGISLPPLYPPSQKVGNHSVTFNSQIASSQAQPSIQHIPSSQLTFANAAHPLVTNVAMSQPTQFTSLNAVPLLNSNSSSFISQLQMQQRLQQFQNQQSNNLLPQPLKAPGLLNQPMPQLNGLPGQFIQPLNNQNMFTGTRLPTLGNNANFQPQIITPLIPTSQQQKQTGTPQTLKQLKCSPKKEQDDKQNIKLIGQYYNDSQHHSTPNGIKPITIAPDSAMLDDNN